MCKDKVIFFNEMKKKDTVTNAGIAYVNHYKSFGQIIGCRDSCIFMISILNHSQSTGF